MLLNSKSTSHYTNLIQISVSSGDSIISCVASQTMYSAILRHRGKKSGNTRLLLSTIYEVSDLECVCSSPLRLFLICTDFNGFQIYFDISTSPKVIFPSSLVSYFYNPYTSKFVYQRICWLVLLSNYHIPKLSESVVANATSFSIFPQKMPLSLHPLYTCLLEFL